MTKELHPLQAQKIHDLNKDRAVLKSAFRDCVLAIEKHVGEGRRRNIALMKIEEATLWAMQDVAQRIAEVKEKGDEGP